MASAAVGPRKGAEAGGGTPPQQPPPPPPEQGLRCPRCDSQNTKFCYYNNYSLSQPRHFCKTCRRYWTKGGALRNVPVGGGCRKNKRSRSAAAAAAAASSRLSLNLPVEGISPAGDQAAASASASARLGFLGGVTVSSPLGGGAAVDFQSSVGMMPLVPRLHSPVVGGQYGPFGEWPSGGPGDINGGGTGGGGPMNGGGGQGAAVSSTIASSIESLSFINQDLHWKLQQQRLATMFLGPPSTAAHVDGSGGRIAETAHVGGVSSGAFLQMAAPPSGMEGVPVVTPWFMDSSYALPSPPTPAAAVATTSSNINSGRSSAGGGDDNATSNNNNCGSASTIPAWGDISTFAMLP